jgi:hypothetical protein
VIPAQVTDHVAQGLALFIEYFQNKPNLAALTSSYLNQIQEIENVFFDVLTKRYIANAKDAQLDTLGRIVGQPRIGATDDIYRLWILARIRANVSNGRADDIIQVAQLVLQGLSFTYDDYYPASFVVDVTEPMTVDAPSVASIIGITRGAGIGSALLFASSTEDNSFTFADGDDQEDDIDRGFADDASTVGGEFVDVL